MGEYKTVSTSLVDLFKEVPVRTVPPCTTELDDFLQPVDPGLLFFTTPSLSDTIWVPLVGTLEETKLGIRKETISVDLVRNFHE